METPVLEEVQEKIKSNSFGEKKHLLLLNDKVLSFDDTTINLQEITHFKFGIKMMQIGMFPIGRKYQIHVKTSTIALDLVFRSYFTISDEYFYDLFEKLVDGIWLRIGDQLVENAINFIRNGGSFEVGDCSISLEGITINQNTLRAKKQHMIDWHDLSYDKKYNRLVINSKSNRNIWVNVYYLDNWNAGVLIEILDWVFEEGGLNELRNNIPLE